MLLRWSLKAHQKWLCKHLSYRSFLSELQDSRLLSPRCTLTCLGSCSRVPFSLFISFHFFCEFVSTIRHHDFENTTIAHSSSDQYTSWD